jgi:hypothetical protein
VAFGVVDHDDRPDVILLDTSWSSTELFAHELARHGLNVHAFTSILRRPPYLRARYPYRSFQIEPDVNRWPEALLDMVERVRPTYIIPGGEESLYWLWEQPQPIQRLCLPNVPEALRPLLLDRAVLLSEAASWGVPTPQSLAMRNLDDCLAAIAGGVPLVVKSGQSFAGTGVALCRTPGEVIDAFQKYVAAGQSVTAQQFYTGGSYLAGGMFVHGEPVHFYAGESIEAWPPLTGYSLKVRSVGEPRFSAMLKSAQIVAEHLDWTGLASFDFVCGDEDDHLRLVDFNPRHWGSADAAGPSGADVFGGLARWIKCGDAGAPTNSVPGVSHRVFPKYQLEISPVGVFRRLAGMHDAPWHDLPLLLGEAEWELRHRVIVRLARSGDSKLAVKLRAAFKVSPL